MLILAIDTSTNVASVALYDSKKGVIGEINLNIGLNHSETILAIIDNLFNITKYSKDKIDRVVVSIGPGSFTGIRVGVAIAKGIVYGKDIEIVGINELDMLSYTVSKTDKKIISMIDARKEKVFYAEYKYDKSEIKQISEYRVDFIKNIIENSKEEFIFTGDGAIKYREKILEYTNNKGIIINNSTGYSRAAILAELGIKKEAENIHKIEPYYVNKTQAELEKEKKV
ncbi:tRNA threonylcarbamoyl adenosine modification protein YeaZ [Hypnocyclicus thermotrophus]|uniref:tRNA threonylcarbamoyl adenosine modification protein YeaZ n=1 Tax=Hypnocyclicus thermotrophus TaxID=1627895 RepID=A0AA46DXQ2_9FUSO|nr:tRNA (adenosine(37)-N6)-threonylcarbamoyltransferase complex dimerization subunit type 1 TsaB [Hypnocyclicus thermotrophus]TDT67900.1 tRNA threonylcarbamoyl adenosine modification protein YeaZ [Hypnocyclicus thermotrophus]